MEQWLIFARGPFFRFTFAVMVLGLARHLVVTVWTVVDAYRMSSDKNVSWGRALRQTLGWLVPFRHMGHRPVYSLVSIVFHVAVIVAPVFFLGHIRMIQALSLIHI